jgi:N-acetylglucosamine repressor
MRETKIKQRAIASLESTLIQHVRLHEGTSRIELARVMDLAPSTIGLYVDRLIEGGFLLEGQKSRRTAGRPPTLLELNPEAGQFVGVDFEARQLSATAVDFSQQTLDRRKQTIRATDTPDQVIEKIKSAVIDVAGGRRRPLLGIGVAVPGTVDPRRGVALHYKFIHDWRNVPLVKHLVREFHVPVYLENNIRAMALAERWFGQARGVENFVCLGIRSGIGAGVMVNGQLYRGRNNLAGEIGGWACLPEAGATNGPDTLEQLASTRAILQLLTGAALAGRKTSLAVRRGRVVTVDQMLQAARAGDSLVLEVLQRTARILGRTINQFTLLLNPEQVILAGPLADLGDVLLDPVRTVVERFTPALHAKAPRIVASQLGEYGGALGAAAMAVHQWKPVR